MKKLTSCALALVMAQKLTSCALALVMALMMLTGAALSEGGAAGHTIAVEEFPLYDGEKNTGVTVPLYFLDGAKDLPYIEADDWLWLMKDL